MDEKWVGVIAAGISPFRAAMFVFVRSSESKERTASLHKGERMVLRSHLVVDVAADDAWQRYRRQETDDQENPEDFNKGEAGAAHG